MDRAELRRRTLDRGNAIWQDLDLNGITSGDAALESRINQLGKDGTRGAIMIVDGIAEAEALNRDRLHALDMHGVEQERRLASERLQTQRQVLALKTAGELLIVGAREYDAEIAGLIMAARRYAETLGRSGVEVAKQRALMDVKKEEAHLKETEAAIAVELLNQQQVKVDVARARLDAAKAVVRALTAETEVRQTELRVVQSGLDLVLTEVENATLTADIAGIYADIVTRGLASIRYEVEKAQIEQAASEVARKLEDMLAIWNRRTEIEAIRAQYELLFRQEDMKQHGHQWRAEWLAQFTQDLQEQVFAAERAVAQAHQDCELAMKDAMEAKRRYAKEVEADAGLAVFEMNQAADAVLQAAHAYVQRYTRYEDYSESIVGRRIRKGYLSGGHRPSPGGSVDTVPKMPTLTPISNVTLPECE